MSHAAHRHDDADLDEPEDDDTTLEQRHVMLAETTDRLLDRMRAQAHCATLRKAFTTADVSKDPNVFSRPDFSYAVLDRERARKADRLATDEEEEEELTAAPRPAQARSSESGLVRALLKTLSGPEAAEGLPAGPGLVLTTLDPSQAQQQVQRAGVQSVFRPPSARGALRPMGGGDAAGGAAGTMGASGASLFAASGAGTNSGAAGGAGGAVGALQGSASDAVSAAAAGGFATGGGGDHGAAGIGAGGVAGGRGAKSPHRIQRVTSSSSASVSMAGPGSGADASSPARDAAVVAAQLDEELAEPPPWDEDSRRFAAVSGQGVVVSRPGLVTSLAVNTQAAAELRGRAASALRRTLLPTRTEKLRAEKHRADQLRLQKRASASGETIGRWSVGGAGGGISPSAASRRSAESSPIGRRSKGRARQFATDTGSVRAEGALLNASGAVSRDGGQEDDEESGRAGGSGGVVVTGQVEGQLGITAGSATGPPSPSQWASTGSLPAGRTGRATSFQADGLGSIVGGALTGVTRRSGGPEAALEDAATAEHNVSVLMAELETFAERTAGVFAERLRWSPSHPAPMEVPTALLLTAVGWRMAARYSQRSLIAHLLLANTQAVALDTLWFAHARIFRPSESAAEQEFLLQRIARRWFRLQLCITRNRDLFFEHAPFALADFCYSALFYCASGSRNLLDATLRARLFITVVRLLVGTDVAPFTVLMLADKYFPDEAPMKPPAKGASVSAAA
ncbi:hypothetical protein FNF27_05104 [Cafeteria roenbergensis]|uniref:Uncharacterized protein n=1 Tax=Cafeteria roenbergensis TaxID=33653 RepID=A0A5A8E8G4_CAFRO|nr:hypothetical protein FNF27_05104 [Cafeteria roenbergensis]